ncbi:hypothetical protein AVT46_gp36 [Mycobacterium phage MOOREtheMARYer]|uniref:Uncharacterized protein n=1 Tax=Mycobacterium phage MOOREtheMARYer TaxID=1647309 RepID=A0A0F6SJV9_9CAUD|nr:hypothetical protein AVT46_gp36 [Mycobacterium phage MOOREtheMARYer]AKF14897.1 hypothetical protein SEA_MOORETHEMARYER_36 [Mycobacterium phage MOOREtheMARYer]
MDDKQVRLVNVTDECAFSLLGFPSGAVDIHSKIPPAELASTLRALADRIESKAGEIDGRNN